jgi:putative ABC transport system substrate-binding protein
VTPRRRLLAGLAGAVALQRLTPAIAQRARARRIAILWGGGTPEQLATVRATIAREGFPDGLGMTTDVRHIALDGSDAQALTEGALRDGAELILVQGPVVPPVHRLVAERVPTVIAFSGDPVAAGIVDNLRRPGHRTTGVSFLVAELCGKRLEMLVEIAPAMRRVGVLLNSRHYGYQAELAETQRAAQALRVATEVFDARSPGEFDPAFQAMGRARIEGFVVFPDALMTRMAPEIAAFAIRERMPAVAGWAAIARGGVLASYGPDLDEAYERVGMQVVRILRGADASMLPVEQPTRIRIVVNQKTAAASGLTLSPALVARADEVIR